MIERQSHPVVVLCGGLGTRLRGVVEGPKVLAPVGGQPYLRFLLRWLVREGLGDIVLATGFGSDAVASFVSDELEDLALYAESRARANARARAGEGRVEVTVRCVPELEPLGTGGAFANAVRAAAITGPFFGLNGDTLFTGSPSVLAERLPPDAAAVIAVTKVGDSSRYGTVLMDLPDSGAARSGSVYRVTGFQEKDPQMSKRPGWINAGLYLMRSERFAEVNPGVVVSLERDLFPQWMNAGLRAVPFTDAEFLDIGTPNDYARAVSYFSRAGWMSPR
ncbi:MAG: NTP transferase domain-containing protein [Bacteroidetes bacterium]|nr:NTP transferase domain-containing protein [Bacteroidota bacterium]